MAGFGSDFLESKNTFKEKKHPKFSRSLFTIRPMTYSISQVPCMSTSQNFAVFVNKKF